MAELTLTQDERPGIAKEVDEGAWDLLFSAVQEDIYSFPIRSFVRETISNCLDGITEKNIFKAIQAGEPVAKYYLQREDDGKALKDSSFNRDYYTDKFLSTNNKVMVTYTEGSPRDSISIKDEGVGLGGERLKGFFKLGFSSKRNMKLTIGKFGFGAKAGLATGVDYFVMTTVYNGFKTSFMIFRRDYDPITPESPTTETEVWKVSMADGTIVSKNIYWEPTTESNGVTVSLEVKKHNRNLFIDAVKSQFQYFKGDVHLTTVDESGYKTADRLDEKPLYESDTLLIPKYSTYSSPHILVDGISYGVVSWEELELDKRHGRIAIKVSATDVDITQSRESLKWTEKTKRTILSAISKTKDEAAEYTTKKLDYPDDQDIFHINRLYSSMHTRDSDSVDSIFKRFLDISHIAAKFTLKGVFGGVEARMNIMLFDCLFYSFKMRSVRVYSDSKGTHIRATEISTFSAIGDSKIIYGDESTLGPKLALHILNKYDVGSFIYIRKNPTRTRDVLSFRKVEYPTTKVNAYTKNLLLKYCDLNLDTYDVVYEEAEADLEEGVVIPKDLGVASRLRKANKEILYYQYDWRMSIRWSEYKVKRVKNTVKISELKDSFTEPVIIVPSKFTALGKLVEVAHYITKGFYAENVIYISQESVKHILPYGILVTDYFRQLNTQTGELMVGENIRNLNTLRIFRDILEKNKTYSGNQCIIEDLTTINMTQYSNLTSNSGNTNLKFLISKNGGLESKLIDEVFEYLEVLEKFQKVVRTGDSAEISKQALALFGSSDIYHLDAYDADFIDTMEAEFKRLEPVEPLLEVLLEVDLTRATGLINLLLETKNNLRK